MAGLPIYPWCRYGFCWGMNPPTHTPTPAKPVNLPQGFPYLCHSLNANTNTFVKNANNMDMEGWNAKSRRQCEELGKRPWYLRYNVFWDDDKLSRLCAEWMEIAQPLSPIPLDKLNNELAVDTINHHPDLFIVSNPINIDNFEDLLIHHPNPPFVKSVINGFWNEFWPWADTHIGTYPHTLDESLGDSKNQKELNFICEQCDKEIKAGLFCVKLVLTIILRYYLCFKGFREVVAEEMMCLASFGQLVSFFNKKSCSISQHPTIWARDMSVSQA